MVYADMCIIGKHPWCRSLLRKLSILNINKQNWSKYILRCRHSKTFCTVKNYTTGLTIRGPAATRVIPSKDWKLRYHLRGILVNRPKTGKKTQYPHTFIKSSYPPPPPKETCPSFLIKNKSPKSWLLNPAPFVTINPLNSLDPLSLSYPTVLVKAFVQSQVMGSWQRVVLQLLFAV